MSGMAKRMRRKALVSYARELKHKAKAGEKGTVAAWAFEVKRELAVQAYQEQVTQREAQP